VIATTNPDTDESTSIWDRAGRPKGVLVLRGAALRRRPVQGPAAVPQRRRAHRARKWGIEDLDKQYDLTELAKGDCIFAADRRDRRLRCSPALKRKAGVMTPKAW